MDIVAIRNKQQQYVTRLEKALRLGATEFADFKEHKRIVKNMTWEKLPTGRERRILEQASAIQRAHKLQNIDLAKQFFQLKIDYYILLEKLTQQRVEIKHNSEHNALQAKIQQFFNQNQTVLNMYSFDN